MVQRSIKIRYGDLPQGCKFALVASLLIKYIVYSVCAYFGEFASHIEELVSNNWVHL